MSSHHALNRPVKVLEAWKRTWVAGLIRRYDPPRSFAPPFSLTIVAFLITLGIIYFEAPWNELVAITGIGLFVVMIILWFSAAEKR